MSKRTSDGLKTNDYDRDKRNKEEGKKSKNEVKKDFAPKKLQIKLNQKDGAKCIIKTPAKSVAAVFGEESDEEVEEMPPEAKMRMRNIGRDTPTSAGPNSYGKTKQGFCNVKKVYEKALKEELDSNEGNPKTTTSSRSKKY